MVALDRGSRGAGAPSPMAGRVADPDPVADRGSILDPGLRPAPLRLP